MHVRVPGRVPFCSIQPVADFLFCDPETAEEVLAFLETHSMVKLAYVCFPGAQDPHWSFLGRLALVKQDEGTVLRTMRWNMMEVVVDQRSYRPV